MGLGVFTQFTAGFPAVAQQVNNNFNAITAWSNGNITSENLGQLTDTLEFVLNSNVNGITIQNSGNLASLAVTQSDNLANGEAIITLDDSTITQTGVDSAEFRIKAKTASTIPAIWVTHAAVDTLKLTRTALDVSSAVTTTLGGPLVLSNPAVTGPINLSGNLTVTGKETINRTSTNQFLELANTTTSKSLTVTPQTASFDLNINDTASAYNFKIDGTTKAVIDNNGIDGQYLKTASVPPSAISGGGIPASVRLPSTMYSNNVSNGVSTNTNGSTTLNFTILDETLSVSAANKNVLILLNNGSFSGSGTFTATVGSSRTVTVTFVVQINNVTQLSYSGSATANGSNSYTATLSFNQPLNFHWAEAVASSINVKVLGTLQISGSNGVGTLSASGSTRATIVELN